MENYIVSARKYRPATFDSVVGQRALTTTLKNAIATGKLAHAYLFCGPRGVGKTTCARIFAKTINCLNPTPDGEACNQCESCCAFNEQRSYNIHELDAASNNSVDDIRQLVEQVRIPPQIGKYKVYIIDEVHMLSTAAFNAFLKTLEEPPHHAIFILATTEKHKILPTILSRCQIYDFNRIGVEDTVAHLANVASKEGITAEPEALNIIALKADGGMRDALSIFDQVVSFTGGHITYEETIKNLNVLDYEYYFRLTDFFLANKVSDALLLFNEVLNKGFDGSHFISGLASHLRDLLVSKDPVTLPLLEVGASIRRRYQAQAQECPTDFLYKSMKLCNDCDLSYRASKNKRLLVELTLIQAAQLTQTDGESISGRTATEQQIKPISTKPDGNITQPQAQHHKPGATRQDAPQAMPQKAVPKVAGNVLPKTDSRLQEEKKIPVVDKSKLGISIKKTQQEEQPKPSPSSDSDKAANSDTEADQPIDEAKLNYQWQRYAAELPQEQVAIAKRMQNMRVNPVNDTTFEVVVDNNIIAKDFTSLIPDIESFMREKLNNRHITIEVKISAPVEKARVYTRAEQFRMMSEKNNALLELKDMFGLEFY